MILIADGGSTKCDWIFMNLKGEELSRVRTKGLNPSVLSNENLSDRLVENSDLHLIREQVEKIYFYGAGCGTETPKIRLQNVFQDFFLKSNEIHIAEDLVAAVHAVTTSAGIVCILGTGSNSCYFDGNEIHLKTPSLGYILMDEASGNYFGKQLLRDYFYEKMPPEISVDFERNFNLNPDYIKENLYKKGNPNAYLASFSKFIFGREEHSYFHDLVSNGIHNFIVNRVLCYKEAQNVPVHFIGSIAFFSKNILFEVMESHGLKLGNIVQSPIDGLFAYYKNKFTNS